MTPSSQVGDPSNAPSSAGNPGAQQGGASGAQTDPSSIDPFAGIILDDLDPATRKQIELGKTQFASLQKQQEELRAAQRNSEDNARKFQARYDQAQAQLKQLVGDGSIKQADPRAEQLDKMSKILVSRGVSPESATTQAELMTEILSDLLAISRQKLVENSHQWLQVFFSAMLNHLGIQPLPLTKLVHCKFPKCNKPQ